MTKKDYIIIANAFKKSYDYNFSKMPSYEQTIRETLDNTLDVFANELIKYNPKFNKRAFEDIIFT